VVFTGDRKRLGNVHVVVFASVPAFLIGQLEVPDGTTRLQ
jgi:hypothetical protein